MITPKLSLKLARQQGRCRICKQDQEVDPPGVGFVNTKTDYGHVKCLKAYYNDLLKEDLSRPGCSWEPDWQDLMKNSPKRRGYEPE